MSVRRTLPISPERKLPAGMVPPDARREPLKPGEIGDCYQIVSEIARGGMGVVFEARHRDLGRTVALKIVRDASFANAEDFGRFRAEREVVAHLDHPNIVPIYDIGEIGGQPFFTMKLIEGGNLADLVKAGPMPPRQVARLMAKVARAVQHAHERGVLHRDLKPGNILLDARGEPFLTDFGLAKFSGKETGLTITGALIGTPEYMAPEQVRGETHDLTTACDVWALGVLIYQCVAGQIPFAGKTALHVMDRIAKEEAALLPNSGDLGTIVARCLEKDASRRMPGAGFLADELDRWLAGEPIRSRHVTPVERGWKWVRRNPLRVAAMATLAATVAAGSVVSYLLWQREQAANFSLNAANTSLSRVNDDLASALRLSNAQRLASESRVIMQEDPSIGLLLAAEAAETTRRVDGTVLPQAASALYHALQQAGGWDSSASQERELNAPRLVGRNSIAAIAMQPSPNGRWFASLHVGAEGATVALFAAGEPRATEPLRRWRICGPSAAPSSCVDMEWSGDSKSLVSIGFDGIVREWDLSRQRAASLEDGAPPCRVLGRLGDATSDRRNARILGGGPNGPRGLLILEAIDGRDRLRWHGLEYTKGFALGPATQISASKLNEVALALRVSPDGRWAFRGDAFGDGQPTIIAIDGASGVPEETPLPEGRTAVECSAFSPDGRWLVFARTDGTLRCYEPAGRGADEASATGRTILRSQSDIRSVAFTPDGKSVLAVGDDSVAWLIRLEESTDPIPVRLPARAAWSVSFSPDGKWLAVGGEDRVVRAWPAAGLPQLHDPVEFRGLSGTVVDTRFSPDGKFLYAIGADFGCRRWKFTGNPGAAMPHSSARLNAKIVNVAASPKGRWLAAIHCAGDMPGSSGGLALFDAAKGMARHDVASFPDPSSVTCSQDGKWIAAVAKDARVRVWQMDTLTAALELGNTPPAPTVLQIGGTRSGIDCHVAFHPSGRLYCATGDGQIVTWNLTAPDPAASEKREAIHSIRYLLPAIAVSPDGKWLAVARHGWDTAPKAGSTQKGNLVMLFDATDPDRLVPRHELRSHHRDMARLAFSADSRWLAAGAQDGPAYLWDLAAHNPATAVRQSPASAHTLLGVSFTSGGENSPRWLALGGSDGRLHLWDWQRGAGIYRTIETSTPITSVAFLLDGRLATGGADGRLRLWETDAAKLVELARTTAGREMQADERDRYLRQR